MCSLWCCGPIVQNRCRSAPGCQMGGVVVIYNLCNTPLRVLISGTICYDEGQSWDEKLVTDRGVSARNYARADCIVVVRKICNITCPLSISLDGPLKPPPSLIGSPYQNNPSCVFCNGQYVFVTQNHISPSHTFFCNYFIFTHKLTNSWICRR